MITPTPEFHPCALIDAVEWSSTPLGPRSTWPRSLETLLALIMRSRRPQYLVWGPDRRFFYNEQFLPVMGVKHPHGFGMPMAEVWPEVWEEIEPLVSSTINEGRSHYFEDRPFVLRRSGNDELTYFSFSYTPAQGDDGIVAGLMCVLTERTEHVATEMRQRAELQRMEELFRQAPGFVSVTHGPDHVYALVNDAYELVTGHRREMLIGQRIQDALPEVAEQGYIRLLDHVYATGEPFVGQSMPVRLFNSPSGQSDLRYVDFIYQPIRDANGSVSGIFTQGSDVSARVLAERELLASENALRDANSSKDQFLAVLGHELRNPLAAIHMACEVLVRIIGDDPRCRQCVDVLTRQARHMASLVEDLVDVARITKGLIALRRETIDANLIVDAAIEQLRSKAAERKHDLQASLTSTSSWVEGDMLRLTQVVSNLLANAIRYTPPGGIITVSVIRRDDVVVIEVADNGEGIAPELMSDLFLPFMQAKRSTDRANGGLGVGLPLAKSLIDAHGGKIRAHSGGIGKGATFSIELPRVR